MKKSRRRVIQQAHEYLKIHGALNFYEGLEKEFPELFEKEGFKEGVWYIIDDNIFYCTHISDNGNLYGYGVFKGKWETREDTDSSICACNETAALDRLRPATEEDLIEAFTRECVKKGLVEGVTVKIPKLYLYTLTSAEGVWCNDNSFCIGGVKVFEQGKWVELAETITKRQIIEAHKKENPHIYIID